VIGVLTPETDVERNLANVEDYVRSHEIPYPVAVDTDWSHGAASTTGPGPRCIWSTSSASFV
jgi:hypothetical protein